MPSVDRNEEQNCSCLAIETFEAKFVCALPVRELGHALVRKVINKHVCVSRVRECKAQACFYLATGETAQSFWCLFIGGIKAAVFLVCFVRLTDPCTFSVITPQEQGALQVPRASGSPAGLMSLH